MRLPIGNQVALSDSLPEVQKNVFDLLLEQQAPKTQKDNIFVFIRYKNRKLYDKTQKCYTTSATVLNHIANEEDVMVIDNDTKEDVTAMTVLSNLFDRVSDTVTLEQAKKVVKELL